MSKAKPGKAPAIEYLVEQVRDLVKLHRNRLSIQSQRVSRIEQSNHVSFPEDAENPQEVLSGTFDQQLGLWRGLFEERPQLVLPIEETPGNDEKARLQLIQNVGNGLPWLLERQGRPVLAPCMDDLGLHGYCVWRVDMDLPRMGNQMPDRAEYEDADEYSKARESKIRAMGMNTGENPLRWTRTDPRNFFWEERDDGPGLSLAVEVRIRKLGRFLKEERYQRKMPKLRAKFKELLQNDPAAAAKAWVPFIVVEDGDWCSYLALTDAMGTTDILQDATVVAQRILDAAGDAELADQYPSVLGMPQYVLTDGLTTNSTDPGRAKKGICDSMSSLVDRYDAMLSFTMTEYVNFGAFPPVVVVEDVVRDQYGNAVVASEDDAGTADTQIDLKQGFHKITPLRPGQKFQYVRPEGMGPDGVRMKDDLRHLIGLHGIPDSLGEQNASSGYQYSQQVNTVHSRYKPQIGGIQRGWQETMLLMFRLLRIAYKGEKAQIATPGAKPSVVTWVTINPDKDLADLDFPMEVVFEFKNPADDLAMLQAYHQASDPPNPAMTKNRARQKYIKLDDAENESSQLVVQEYLASPEMQQWVRQAALKKFDQKLAAQQAAAQGAFSAQDLQGATPAVAQTIDRMAQPGMPGYGAVQQAQGLLQPGMAQPPTSVQGPQIQGPPAIPGGRPAGQARQPGGPRRTGGL